MFPGMVPLSARDLEALAVKLDGEDPLKGLRDRFKLPTLSELFDQVKDPCGQSNGDGLTEVIYLCTNSLGLPPKSTGQNLEKVLESWRTLGVLSHTLGYSPTETSDLRPKKILAEYIVGAKVDEVAVMESLSANIHTLLASFYRPQGEKCCILVEKNAFPSDYYALESHIHLRDFAPTSGHKYAPVLTGWWGHRYSTRFQMTNMMEVEGGADSYRRSCPSMLLNSALTSSLEIFAEAGGMIPIREKSIMLTGYLQSLLLNSPIAQSPGLEIITPCDPQSRGSQLSIKVNVDVDKLYDRLIKRGVICDTRRPCFIRLAPFALYTSFADLLKASRIITEEVEALVTD
ncbi:unnamed protein product [Hydatigera taeniaeformis]|uniref:Kynureninase n=1 Tax=Hydatigena taeniaeformis TaxID=6205 RepID=A0A0R3XCQ4_HYDTA|nr:unnamed protein product [Hydatigera taeniaeformis]